MREPVYNTKGQITGSIEFGTLIKRNVDPERHQLRKPPAYAIDKAHFDRLIEVLTAPRPKTMPVPGPRYEPMLKPTPDDYNMPILQ